jgi:HK97 family phage portal protein
MQLVSNQTKLKFFDWTLEQVNKASRAIGRISLAGTTDNVDWTQEEYQAYKVVFQDVWTYVCGNLIATNAALLPIGAFKRQPKTKGSEFAFDEDHPVSRILYEPNPWQTGPEFIEATAWSLRISGQYFHELVRDGYDKVPEEIYVLDPRQVQIVPDAKNFIKKYKVNVNGTWEDFAPYQISWGKHCNPSNPYEALSPATASGNSINQNIAAGKYGTMFFRNGGMPLGTMESDRRLSEPDYERIRTNWSKSVKGVQNWFKLLILEGGLKYKQVQASPRDLALVDLKEQVKSEILAGQGVPALLVGDTRQFNYSNSKEVQKLFWRNTMSTVLRLIAGRMTKDLVIKSERTSGKVKVLFDLSGVDALQEDQEIKSRIAFNLQKSGVMCWDEIRKILYRMQPYPNGIGSEIYMPSNMVTAAALIANGGKPIANVGTGQSGKPGGPDASSQDEGKKPGANAGKPAKMITDEEFRKFLEEIPDDFFKETILVG